MTARIFQPAKTAMQSGKSSNLWLLEMEQITQKNTDPLLGWVGSSDTKEQIRLEFATLDQAVAYAKANNISVIISPPTPVKQTIRPLGYGGNFITNRREGWTH